MTEPTEASSGPQVDRPAIPAEYGAARAREFVAWSHVEARLEAERVYWLVTVGPDGRPRVRPVDALYVGGVIYVGGSPETRWVRDVTADSHVALHLDGVGDVVIIEGEADILTHVSDELARDLAAASNAKFPEYRMSARTYKERGAIAVRIRKVIAWSDITTDPTRFRFDGAT